MINWLDLGDFNSLIFHKSGRINRQIIYLASKTHPRIYFRELMHPTFEHGGYPKMLGFLFLIWELPRYLPSSVARGWGGTPKKIK